MKKKPNHAKRDTIKSVDECSENIEMYYKFIASKPKKRRKF